MNPDQITLTLPGDRQFFAVAHLVLGGLAVRLDLGYEQLEDLQAALTLLLNHQVVSQDLTLVVSIDGDELEATVGPLDAATEVELAREAGPEVDLRRVLDTVVDSVEVTKRDGQPWVTLHKSIERSGIAT